MSEKKHIASPLSQSFLVDGHRLNVKVLKRDNQEHWSVEVVDNIGTLTAWNDMFDTDRGALDFVLEQFNTKGATGFIE